MTHIMLVNVIFFIVPTCGAFAFGFVVYRLLRVSSPPESLPPAGGSKIPLPAAGPDDLARSA